MHPQNKLIKGYDFLELGNEFPLLKPFIYLNKFQRPTLDFSKKKCVQLFNAALLKKYYSIDYWQFPSENLCPTIPGRADYLHYLYDLIGKGSKKILDIGTGASVIYPLLGQRIFNWQFVATEVDITSLECARTILQKNNFGNHEIELRLQPKATSIFDGVVKVDEVFDACICNPPFFESEEQALRWNQRKWKSVQPNSVGTHSELIFPGGEKKFIAQMIQESVSQKNTIKFFTCLVSKQSTIPLIEKTCAENEITSLNFIEIKTGRKVSRIAVWQP